MAGFLNVLFNDDMLITEAFHSLTLGSIELIEELFFMSDNTHSLATAAEGGLDDDGEADLFGFTEQKLGILVVTMVARHDRHLRVAHDELRFALGTHRVDRFCGGTDEHLEMSRK